MQNNEDLLDNTFKSLICMKIVLDYHNLPVKVANHLILHGKKGEANPFYKIIARRGTWCVKFNPFSAQYGPNMCRQNTLLHTIFTPVGAARPLRGVFSWSSTFFLNLAHVEYARDPPIRWVDFKLNCKTDVKLASELWIRLKFVTHLSNQAQACPHNAL